MDDRGWTKTKKGRVVYHDKPKPFTQIDIKRISRNFLEYGDDYQIPEWFTIVADLFENIIVNRFRSIPYVSEVWEFLREMCAAEAVAGRPMTFTEQLRYTIRALSDVEIHQSGSKEQTKALWKRMVKSIEEDSGFLEEENTNGSYEKGS